ncbi:Hint domain-containing protein [Ruixingdingia sedimenti]|uniref:Hint domain-containing protein n=1 Tax=Ruixingdingia sedimenti TaxID=3073604 RepID=A0ABU1FED1_9RHOB|nr:Hint domain-containing protein [Xinfangfangia sp. LG-4]MDR5654913.1 Hint domain-containing protein [Xinfangfangia sp. LG-4]
MSIEAASAGTFVVSWSQTEADGVPAPAPDLIRAGAGWRWTGRAVRLDAPGDLLVLQGAAGADELRARAARMVRRLVGAALAPAGGRQDPVSDDLRDDAPEQGFLLTDGRQSYAATVIEVPDAAQRLVMFLGAVPPAGADLWVVRSALDCRPPAAAGPDAGGVICFAPGTLIATPDGPRAIEALRPGDRIDTRDNGPQEILWTGQRRMTGARLYAMPQLRPVRIRAGAMGIGRPDRDLLVSPQHRMLVRGAPAQALFGTPEVLVAAEHLVNGQTVAVDMALREVTYVHVLLEAHQIVLANGLETESFHPAYAALDTLDPASREGLFALMPGLARDPGSYGAPARRNLTAFESAILRHEAA